MTRPQDALDRSDRQVAHREPCELLKRSKLVQLIRRQRKHHSRISVQGEGTKRSAEWRGANEMAGKNGLFITKRRSSSSDSLLSAAMVALINGAADASACSSKSTSLSFDGNTKGAGCGSSRDAASRVRFGRRRERSSISPALNVRNGRLQMMPSI